MPPVRHSKSVMVVPSEDRIRHEVNHEPCSVCGLVVKYKGDIARHQKQHAENKEELMTPCPWPECDYKSLQRSNVTVHAHKQHNWKIHHCRHSCKFSAVLKKDLAKHLQEVHGTKCTITEWEEEGPIDPDRAPRNPGKKSKKSKKAHATIASSLPIPPSSTLKRKHQSMPTLPQAFRYLEPGFNDAMHCGAYDPKNGINATNFSGWLLWKQWQMFQEFAFRARPPIMLNPSLIQMQQQQLLTQQLQLSLSWNPAGWRATVPTQGRGNIHASQPEQQLQQMWDRRMIKVYDPSAIPGQIIHVLPIAFETVASSSVPAQQRMQQQSTSLDPEIESLVRSRLPLSYTSHRGLVAQQQLTLQQQLAHPVIEKTAVPAASASLPASIAPDLSHGLEDLRSCDEVIFPTGLNVDATSTFLG